MNDEMKVVYMVKMCDTTRIEKSPVFLRLGLCCESLYQAWYFFIQGYPQTEIFWNFLQNFKPIKQDD